MEFSEAIEAQLRGITVRRATLVWFDFKSKPIGLHNGVGPLTTKDGRNWNGLGGLGSVEGLEQAINGAAPEMRLSVSGIDPDFITKAKAEADEYLYRPVIVFAQFFHDDWSLLDEPWAIAWAQMMSLTVARESAGQGDGWVRTLTISAETPFAGKRRPRNSFLTDRDQQTRHPGDRFAERTMGIESHLIRFPAF
ncbi:hypothetical protein [Labrys sp. (in: a-proteobacteria)]|uniref:hypothetical protein n=1 Tax=Labrys sp. (in: a-proteobacteria) TaxID=1917972 RepID=UPI0039E6B775